MVLNPHDLLKIKGPESLHEEDLPLWVKRSLLKAPYIVVRRALWVEGKVPVGIRGVKRSQRFPSYISESDILEQITPEQLSHKRVWQRNVRNSNISALRSLEYVDKTLQNYHFSWGPCGSVGFELTSGIPTAHESSDLDIIIRAPEDMKRSVAKKLSKELKRAPSRIDAQVETCLGAFSLLEVASGTSPIMVRTKEGPDLIKNSF